MKHFSSLVLVAAVWALASLAAHAQPGSGGPGPNPGTNPTGVPIDGGASLLLAGGAAYALRRLRRTGRNPQAR